MSHSLRRSATDSTSQTADGEHLSRSEILVVQCPSCRARFALGADVVAQHEFPRFHCSRCDHVFGYDQVQAKKEAAPQEASQPHMSPPSYEEIEAEVASSEVSNTSKSLEIPKELPPGYRANPPHEQLEELPQMALDFSASAPLPTSVAAPKNYDPFAKAKTTKPSGVTLPDNASLLNPEEAPRSAFSSGAIEQTKARSTAQEDLHSFIERQKIVQSNAPVYVDAKRTFLIGATPILAMLLILGLFVAIAQISPAAITMIGSSLFGQGETVAPPGLLLKQVNLKTLHLESGEMVSLISATVENSTAVKFSDVKVEGILFDSSGEMISTLRTTAASPLTKTRVKSLSPQMIDAMQSAPTPKRFELRPGEEKEVAIAILDEKATDARYFSARIFSVKS